MLYEAVMIGRDVQKMSLVYKGCGARWRRLLLHSLRVRVVFLPFLERLTGKYKKKNVFVVKRLVFLVPPPPPLELFGLFSGFLNDAVVVDIVFIFIFCTWHLPLDGVANTVRTTILVRACSSWPCS